MEIETYRRRNPCAALIVCEKTARLAQKTANRSDLRQRLSKLHRDQHAPGARLQRTRKRNRRHGRVRAIRQLNRWATRPATASLRAEACSRCRASASLAIVIKP